MSKYIVTGGCGFIGSHLVRALAGAGHEVVVVDDLSAGFAENIAPVKDKVRLLKIDIGDWRQLIEEGFNYFLNADGVFHLAAQARIQPSIINPTLTHKSNVDGTRNILEAMRMLGIPKIVYSGSSSSYGPSETINKPSDMPNPQNPYALTKYVGEMYCKTWGKIYGVKNVVLRYFNVYGQRSPLEGQYAPVIGLFFRQILVEGSPMTIVGDGTQRRDFTEVSDVVSANLSAMEKAGRKTVNGKTFNVGTGTNHSILDVASLVAQALTQFGGEAKTKFIPARPGEVHQVLADISLTKKHLGWEPKTDLVAGIGRLTPYYMNYFANRRA